MTTDEIRPGSRVVSDDGATRADVLKVSKDGKRLRVQFWGHGLQDGKLVTMWVYASSWRLVEPRR